jgi:3-demethoxyubiquinol 3-hydroxylase
MSQAATLRAPVYPADGARARRLAEMIRVDHAGEYGAVQIYRGQRAVFMTAPGKERIATMLGEMEVGEQSHLETFVRRCGASRVSALARQPP